MKTNETEQATETVAIEESDSLRIMLANEKLRRANAERALVQNEYNRLAEYLQRKYGREGLVLSIDTNDPTVGTLSPIPQDQAK